MCIEYGWISRVFVDYIINENRSGRKNYNFMKMGNVSVGLFVNCMVLVENVRCIYKTVVKECLSRELISVSREIIIMLEKFDIGLESIGSRSREK